MKQPLNKKKILSILSNARRPLCFVSAALAVLLFVFVIDIGAPSKTASPVVGITIAMCILWISNALPMAVTALLPVFLFPVCGIMKAKDVSTSYFSQVSMVNVGGFMFALAMERWNLHKRVGLRIVLLFGTRLPLLLLGMSFASYFLSFFISNSAATIIMIPNAIAILTQLEQLYSREIVQHFSIALCLGIAYASTFGGMSTLVGTPTNLVLVQTVSKLYPSAPPITFLQWMVFAVPLSLFFFFLMYGFFYFTRVRKTTKAIAAERRAASNPPAGGGGGGCKARSSPPQIVISVTNAIHCDHGHHDDAADELQFNNQNDEHHHHHHHRDNDGKSSSSSTTTTTNKPVPSICSSSSSTSTSACAGTTTTTATGTTNTGAKTEFIAIRQQYQKMGKLSFEELAVGILFTVLVLLWMFRNDFGMLPGWGRLFKYNNDYMADGTVAVAMAILLFIIPARRAPPTSLPPPPPPISEHSSHHNEEQHEMVEVLEKENHQEEARTLAPEADAVVVQNNNTTEEEEEEEEEEEHQDDDGRSSLVVIREDDFNAAGFMRNERKSKEIEMHDEAALPVHIAVAGSGGDEEFIDPAATAAVHLQQRRYNNANNQQQQQRQHDEKNHYHHHDHDHQRQHHGRSSSSSSYYLLDWDCMDMFPWDLILIIGGGFALADGFKVSLLSQYLGDKLSALSWLPPFVLVVGICTFSTFLTELTSNVATSQILLPVLASLATGVGVCPLLFMIPGALSCSYAFMLPIATPPNTIVFATRRISQKEMATTGLLLNIVGIVLTSVAAVTFMPLVFGFKVDEMPPWAATISSSSSSSSEAAS